jgi:hypothetical protein
MKKMVKSIDSFRWWVAIDMALSLDIARRVVHVSPKWNHWRTSAWYNLSNHRKLLTITQKTNQSNNVKLNKKKFMGLCY